MCFKHFSKCFPMSGFHILKRKVGAEMINPCNPDLLKAWRGIQVVGNPCMNQSFNFFRRFSTLGHNCK